MFVGDRHTLGWQFLLNADMGGTEYVQRVHFLSHVMEALISSNLWKY
jgi:hypothetical protein